MYTNCFWIRYIYSFLNNESVYHSFIRNKTLINYMYNTHGTLLTLVKLNNLGSLPVIMANVMDSEILVSEFKPQSRYYSHFRANILGNGMNPTSFPSSYG